MADKAVHVDQCLYVSKDIGLPMRGMRGLLCTMEKFQVVDKTYWHMKFRSIVLKVESVVIE